MGSMLDVDNRMFSATPHMRKWDILPCISYVCFILDFICEWEICPNSNPTFRSTGQNLNSIVNRANDCWLSMNLTICAFTATFDIKTFINYFSLISFSLLFMLCVHYCCSIANPSPSLICTVRFRQLSSHSAFCLPPHIQISVRICLFSN